MLHRNGGFSANLYTNFLILESNVMPIYSPINIIIGLQTIASIRITFVNILTCFTDNSCPSNTSLYTYKSIHSELLCIHTYLFYRQYLSTLYSFVYILTCFTDNSSVLLPFLQTIFVQSALLCIHTKASTPYSFENKLTCLTVHNCLLRTTSYAYLPVLQTITPF